MFGNSSPKITELEDKLRALQKLNTQLIESFAKCATLMDITKHGSANVFTFQHNAKTFEIRTYGTLSDNVEQWKKDAGI